MQSTHKRAIGSFNVESYGVDNPQYFRGAGCDEFEDSAVGVGNSEREAVSDALESLAQNGWDTSTIDATLAKYSDADAVSKVIADAFRDEVGTEPDAEYIVSLYPHNGCGPIMLAGPFDDYADAIREAEAIMARKVADGMEQIGEWEIAYPDNGTSDAEGIVSIDQSERSIREHAKWAKRAERFENDPPELFYYVNVQVSEADAE